MAKRPLITVAMPCYNHEKFVVASIQSVLAQTYENWELIVIDDASSDTSVGQIRKVTDSRIRVICHTKNMGISATINECLREGKGDFFALLASDDLCEPRRLEKQLQFLQDNSEVSTVFCQPKIIDGEGKAIVGSRGEELFTRKFSSRQEWCYGFIFHGNSLCASSAFIRRETFDKVGYHRLALHQLQDLDLWLRMALEFEIRVMDEKLVRYRSDPQMESVSKESLATDNRSGLEYFTILKQVTRLKKEKLTWLFPQLSNVASDRLQFYTDLANIFIERGTQPIHQLFAQLMKYELFMEFEDLSKNEAMQDEIKRLIYSDSFNQFQILGALQMRQFNSGIIDLAGNNGVWRRWAAIFKTSPILRKINSYLR